MTKFLIVTYLVTVGLSGAVFGYSASSTEASTETIRTFIGIAVTPIKNMAAAAFILGAILEVGGA